MYEGVFVTGVFTFIFNEVTRIISLMLMIYVNKNFGSVRNIGLGLGVGAAVCQIFVQTIPYLLLSHEGGDLFLVSNHVGNFVIVSVTGFYYGLYLILSFVSIAQILTANNQSLLIIVFVACHGFILLSSLACYYIDVIAGVVFMSLVDAIVSLATVYSLRKYKN